MVKPRRMLPRLLVLLLLSSLQPPFAGATPVEAYAGTHLAGDWICLVHDANGTRFEDPGPCGGASAPPPAATRHVRPTLHYGRPIGLDPGAPGREIGDVIQGASGEIAAGVKVMGTGVCVSLDPDNPFKVPVAIDCIPDLLGILETVKGEICRLSDDPCGSKRWPDAFPLTP